MKIMQNLFKITMLLALVSILATSCKKDLTEDMDDDATENTEQVDQSGTSNFMTGGDADGDGDFDELCFEFVYPVTIILPDGTNQSAMNDDELFTIIEDFYIANPDSDEDPTFEFPIDVILEDSTTQTLNNEEELEVLFEECFDEYDDDEYDEDCFTLNFPVTVIYPDGTTTPANSEEELEILFEEWEMNNPDAEEYPTLQLPVEITLEDGTVESIGTEEELEELFEECYNDWDDEDDEWEECFEFVYPVNILLPDGTSQAANDEEELEEIIFTWFENNPDDSVGYPTLEFPVDVELDGEIITVNSEDELEELFEECDDDDDDHEGNPFEECFTISYPITVVFPGSTTADVNSNEELEMRIDNWYDQNPDSEDDPTLVYPIEITLMEDGSVVTINNDDELEEIIEECFGCFLGNTNNMVVGNDQAVLTAMTIKQHQSLKNKRNGKIVKKLKKLKKLKN